MKTKELSELLNGELKGSADFQVNIFLEPFIAIAEDSVVLVSDTKVIKKLDQIRAKVLVVKEFQEIADKIQIKVANPKEALVKLLNAFCAVNDEFSGVSKKANIEKSAVIGKNCTIYPGVYIGNDVVIGDNCILYAGVTVYHKCILGDNVVLHGGVVIGADGFGYYFDGTQHIKVPQTGIVVLEDDVEIGANSTVDRATIYETRIGKGTKIDNQVQVAHNVRIGEHVIIAAGCGIAGSVTIKARTIIAGMTGVIDHVTIGEDSIVMSKSRVDKDLAPKSIVSGVPARDHKENIKREAELNRLTKKSRSN